MRLLTVTAILVTATAAAACTGGELASFGEPRPIHLPAAKDATGPRLIRGPDGTTILSWMHREKSGATLRYSELKDGRWQDATDVVSDPEMFVNWADLPSVTPLEDEHWAAHWLSKSAELTYAYDILFSQSWDRGSSWSEPVRPHTDGTPTEHGFVSIFAEGDSAALLWLDGRKTGTEASDRPEASSMTLRAAVVGPQGQVRREQLVDGMVCDCCQTDVALSAAGPIAVYRDRTVEEVRDIYVTRFRDDQWQAGAPIADDGWVIGGCPVNGPAIDANGDLVAVAWFSAANNRTVVRAAISTNSGRTFKGAAEIASARASGHVGVAVIDRHAVVVSWVEKDKHGTNAINIRSLTIGGTLGPAQTVGRSNLVRIYPQMIRKDDKLILAWTDARIGLAVAWIAFQYLHLLAHFNQQPGAIKRQNQASYLDAPCASGASASSGAA